MIWVFLGLGISLAQFFHERIASLLARQEASLVSFSAGLSVAYLFLELLPELYAGVAELKNLVYLWALAGFIVFHLIEKHAYTHEDKKVIEVELEEAHMASFFIYHFLAGVVIFGLAQENSLEVFLFFLPIFINTSLAGLAVHKKRPGLLDNWGFRALFASAALLGSFFASWMALPAGVFYGALGVVVGSLVYLIIRDFVPHGKRGKPGYFVLGAGLYTLLALGIWLL